MDQNTRHGHGALPRGPVAIDPIQSIRPTPSNPRPMETPKPQLTPVRLTQGFLSQLPTAGLSHLARVFTRYWNPSTVKGATVTLTGETVPEGLVWVLTDVDFFATAPKPTLAGTLTYLSESDLAGIFRFDLNFTGNSPMQLGGTFRNPNAGTSIVTTVQSGWTDLRSEFGTKRSPGFALVAQSGSVIQVSIRADSVPKFPITTVGTNIHGFVIPVATWETLREMAKDGK